MSAWVPGMTAAYRVEVERRFRERTPAKNVDDGFPADRVGRGEMRGWTEDRLGQLPPFDAEWIERHARWYRLMALRVLRELDPEMVPVYRAHLRQHPVLPRRSRR